MDFTLEGVCSFDVLQEVTTNKEFIKTFADGRQLITGAFRVRVTNLDTDASLDLNIPGPGRVTENSDGSVTLAIPRSVAHLVLRRRPRTG